MSSTLRHVLLATAVTSAGLAGQQTTSPRGYLTTAGAAVADLGMFDGPPFYAAQLVQLDDTQQGRPQTIKALHLRRSANAEDRPSSKARTLNVMVRMAHGDYGKLTGGLQNLSEMLVGAWASVLPAAKVSFPDMTKRPPAGPAPWSVSIPLARAFPYDGNNALYFQITAWEDRPTESFGYTLDAINENFAWSWGTPVGQGCTHRGEAMVVGADFTVYADSSPSELVIFTFPQVTATADRTVAFIGASNPNQRVPGVCAPLLAQPDVIVPMWQWAFREDGVLGWFEYIQVPHIPQLIGLQLYVQTWAPDSTQGQVPFAGSTGWRTGRYPTPPVPRTRCTLAMTADPQLGVFVEMAGLQQSSGLIVGLEQ